MSTGGGASLEFLEGSGSAGRGGVVGQMNFAIEHHIERNMNKERKLIIAGNWKMNKTVAEALDLVRGLKIDLAQREGSGHRRLPAVHRAERGFRRRFWIRTSAWARRT